MTSDSKLYLKAIGLGAVAGMRSMAAPAILSHELNAAPKDVLQNSRLRYLKMGPVSTSLSVMALGEIVADKIPGVPDRTDLPSLAMRSASGALVGATVFTVAKDDALTGALVGGLAAIAATFGFFYLRKTLGENTTVPDAALGFVEDAIMLGSGISLTSK